MLAAHRFDYFPRSAREVWAELKTHSDGLLALDDHLALHYVNATYFFVNKADTALAEALERGLERAIADGSFERIFEQEIGRFLADAHFNRRNAETPHPRQRRHDRTTAAVSVARVSVARVAPRPRLRHK